MQRIRTDRQLDLLMSGRDLKRCLDENNEIECMRSVQGPQEDNKLIQDCQTMCLSLADGLITVYHVGSSTDCVYICQGSLSAIGIGVRE